MKHQTFLKAVLCCSLLALVVLSAQVQAQPSQFRGRGLYGDWKIKVDYNGNRSCRFRETGKETKRASGSASWA
jgi:hypothetical protein